MDRISDSGSDDHGSTPCGGTREVGPETMAGLLFPFLAESRARPAGAFSFHGQWLEYLASSLRPFVPSEFPGESYT